MIIKHIHKAKRWPKFRTGCRSKADCLRLLKYLQRPEAHPEILRNDFAGDTPEEIADQLEALHRGQKLWGYHVVAAHPPHESNLWDPQAKTRIDEVQRRVGIDKGFWVKHRGHWHGFLMSMRPNGGTIRLGTYDEDGQPVPVALAFRQMAERWEDETPGCTKTGRGDHGLDLSRESLAMAERQYFAHEAPTPIPKKMLLRAQIERLVTLSTSMESLHVNAADAGVEIQYKKDATGKILGISFSQDGVSLRGREAGYSYGKLQKLYDNTTDARPQIIGRHHGMAARTRDPHRYQNRNGIGARDEKPDRRSGETSPIAGTAGGRDHPSVSWPEAALRALSPDTDFLSLLLTLTNSLAAIASQNDFRRRYYPSNPQPDISL